MDKFGSRTSGTIPAVLQSLSLGYVRRCLWAASGKGIAMRLSARIWLALALVAVGIAAAGPAPAVTVDLALVLPNSGYENGTTSSWSTTKPNLTSGWVSSVPVDPSIARLDPCCNNGTTLPLVLAPNGSHFVGVATTDFPGDTLDEKGKLVHNAPAVS